MELKTKFEQTFPEAFFLDGKDKESLEVYLKTRVAVLESDTHVRSIEKPGEGNMNCVLRVQTSEGSFILKQARPWVEKYPQIAAPSERLSVEYAFYKVVNHDPLLQKLSPQVLWFDASSNIMAMTDLGSSSDFSALYQSNGFISEAVLGTLIKYLEALHGVSLHEAFPSNMSMRELNHEHIFNYPFLENNGLDLDQFTPGLSSFMPVIRSNVSLLREIHDLGQVYLAPGSTLIHGDFYPGSWLDVDGSIRVIDPEFAFVGPREFDLGVLLAHLHLSQQGTNIIAQISSYQGWENLDQRLLDSFAGIEVLRRLLGVAQLPVVLDLDQKKTLMEKAMEWIQGEDRPY